MATVARVHRALALDRCDSWRRAPMAEEDVSSAGRGGGCLRQASSCGGAGSRLWVCRGNGQLVMTLLARRGRGTADMTSETTASARVYVWACGCARVWSVSMAVLCLCLCERESACVCVRERESANTTTPTNATTAKDSSTTACAYIRTTTLNVLPD